MNKNNNREAEKRKLLRQAESLQDAMLTIYKDNNAKMPLRFSSFRTFVRKYNMLVEKFSTELGNNEGLDYYNIDKIGNSHNTTGTRQKELFDSVLANLKLLIATLKDHLGVSENQLSNIRDFLQARLRTAFHQEPGSEKEVQNAIEILLIGKGFDKGVDYDREVGRVKVSSKEVIPDFILPKNSLALEVKFIKDSSRKSEIIDEINADIQTYTKGYSRILFVIYDLGSIRDQMEFKQDLEKDEKVSVIIVKH